MNQLHTHHWTYADYLQLPDDGTRCEILEGERHMTPSPFPRHQIVSENLGFQLSLFANASGLGLVLRAPCDVILTDDTVVQPDIMFIPKGRKTIIEERGIFAAPDFVIEILSPSHPQRDTVRKLAIYGRHGVREYWIVDPDARRIEVHVLEGRALVRKAAHDDGEVRSLAVLPGFSAALATIFVR